MEVGCAGKDRLQAGDVEALCSGGLHDRRSDPFHLVERVRVEGPHRFEELDELTAQNSSRIRGRSEVNAVAGPVGATMALNAVGGFEEFPPCGDIFDDLGSLLNINDRIVY